MDTSNVPRGTKRSKGNTSETKGRQGNQRSTLGERMVNLGQPWRTSANHGEPIDLTRSRSRANETRSHMSLCARTHMRPGRICAWASLRLALIRSAPLRMSRTALTHQPTRGVGVAMLSPSVAPDQSTSPLKKIHKCDGNSCIQLG